MELNCFNNFKKEKDGKCYSKTCMFNQDSRTRQKIEAFGCKFFENNLGVIKMRREAFLDLPAWKRVRIYLLKAWDTIWR